MCARMSVADCARRVKGEKSTCVVLGGVGESRAVRKRVRRVRVVLVCVRRARESGGRAREVEMEVEGLGGMVAG